MWTRHKLFRHRRWKNEGRSTHLACKECRQEVIDEEGIDKLNELIDQTNYCLAMNGDKMRIEKEIET